MIFIFSSLPLASATSLALYLSPSNCLYDASCSSSTIINPRLLKGATIRAQVTHFADLKIEDVYRKRLGEFDDQDARREGGYSIDEFKDVWKELHGEWNPNESVYVIRFQLSDVVGENADSG